MHIISAARLGYVAALACMLASLAAADDSGGNLQQWRRVALDRAIQAAGAISDPYRRAEALAGIARAQVAADDAQAAEAAIRSALVAAKQVAEPAFRDWALYDIVLAQIAADDAIGAAQTADRIETTRPGGAAFAAIAGIQLRGGNLPAAQATAARIKNDDSQSEVLRQIVASQVANDALPSARDTLRRIDDPFYQAYALGDVAVAEVHRGNIKAAEALAARARRNYRSLVYGRVALARVDGGDVRGGLDTLNRIDDPLYRAVTQARITSARAIAGDAAEAQRLFTVSLAGIEAFPKDPYRRATTFLQVARLQIAGNDPPGARQTLQRALALAIDVKAQQQRDDALDLIARGQARAGDPGAALATAVNVTDRIARALLIRDVIAVRAERDGTSLAGVPNPDDPLMQAAALFGLLGAQLTKANMVVTAATIDAAHGAVLAIREAELRPAAFAALASARSVIHDADGAATIFEESLAATEAIAREDQRALAYTRIVDALNERLLFLGQPVRDERTSAAGGAAVRP